MADRATYATLLAELLLNLKRPECCLEFIESALLAGPRLTLWDERLRELRAACTAHD